MARKLSPTMQSAVEYARKYDNKITRHPGGFWAHKEWSDWNEHSFGTTTIRALVDRGVAEYTQWQERKHGPRFPIEITLTPTLEAQEGE